MAKLFQLERWAEVFESLNRHRFRTLVTAASVFWGIFMLVILLAAGKGLENKVRWDFRDDAINSLWVHPARTSVAHQGLSRARSLTFRNDDFKAIGEQVPGLEYKTARYYPSGNLRRGNVAASFDVRATTPDHQFVENTIITSGRFLNQPDLDHKRKVIVLGGVVAEHFYKNEDPIGSWITLNDLAYRVVGVFRDDGGVGEMRQVYVPLTTAQAVHATDTLRQMMFTLGDASVADAEAIGEEIRQLLSRRLGVSPEDRRAIRIRNNLERYQEIADVIGFVSFFTWLVGMGTVLAGMVGVSNIMLVSVAERTKEIGLRKALGATPGQIITMVVQETVLLTSASGYAGLVVGVGVVELVRRYMPENESIRDPSVDLAMALAAVFLLTAAGFLAGYFPARAAARIQPIVALRDGA